MAVYVNNSKAASSFANQAFGSAGLTWGEAQGTWGQQEGTWQNPFAPYIKQTKNSSTFNNETKN